MIALLLWATLAGIFAAGFLVGENYRANRQLEVASRATDISEQFAKQNTRLMAELELADAKISELRERIDGDSWKDPV